MGPLHICGRGVGCLAWVFPTILNPGACPFVVQLAYEIRDVRSLIVSPVRMRFSSVSLQHDATLAPEDNSHCVPDPALKGALRALRIVIGGRLCHARFRICC